MSGQRARAELSGAATAFREALADVASSREKSLALTKIDEAEMWASRALDSADTGHDDVPTDRERGEMIAATVLVRDGDNCRFCDARTREPRDGLTTKDDAGLFQVKGSQGSDDPADYVNACRTCVREYTGHNVEALLRPQPAHPFYSAPTARFINDTHPTAHVTPTDADPLEAPPAPPGSTHARLADELSQGWDTAVAGFKNL